jgi:glycosyltransferase involved in cell wall biosynthesis
MKINMLWQFRDEVWGGGNQFLKVLRNYCMDVGCYCDDPIESDIIMVNSKERMDDAIVLKIEYSKMIVHRIDGVFTLYRGEHERPNDLMVYEFSRKYADGVVFQSNWSRLESKKNGMPDHKREVVIRNCSDPMIFNRGYRPNRSKIRLITSSWSDNPKKGALVYKYLDDNLDFDRYEYVFVGRSAIAFKNIKMVGVLSSTELAVELRQSDIFVTATEVDACSNSLTEALSCGVPSVVLNSGGSPEILGDGGELFNSTDDVVAKIEAVAFRPDEYRNRIRIDGVEEIGKRYYDFICKVYNEKQS